MSSVDNEPPSDEPSSGTHQPEESAPGASSSEEPESLPFAERPPRTSRLAVGVLIIALISGGLAALSGFGSRWGFWDFRTGFDLLRWAAYGAIGATVLGLAVSWWLRPGSGRGRGFGVALLALFLAVPVFAVPLMWRARAGDVPRIHDITTDTNDPPQFVDVVPLRADAPNPVEYPGPEVAVQQRTGYPDIRPVILDEPLVEAYARVLEAVRAEGWDLVAASVEEGRIEATDRTFWFGFRDDVVIRLTANGDRTIVDMRSKSRVGGSDVGTNAKRIRDFFARLQG